ncbi:uncharacterized protein LOC135161123 isoform X1 [Diachasmimorpha longicaudata]|uniref:uncharacterized protein LOC135161123 isoform X1 n=1 Tax=Diachasmimorpha longicaudata TaxID=58733 RepID=UPI0030B8BF78
MSAPPPPPPPAFNISSVSSADPQGRNQLLQSIRAGKQLKKTVTVDKSAPAISGKVKNGLSPNSPASPSVPSSTNSTITSGPMALGGLFAGGMPKLKPTGLRTAIVEKEVSSPPATHSSGTMKRGPPPVPPPAAQKPQMQTESPPEPSKGFGKPTLAPKPPGPPPAIISGSSTLQKPCPPPKKLDLLRSGGVSRAQSMRLPRSPPVLAPNSSSLHQSQDCLNETHQRPINRVLRPPVARPPSPPISRNPSGSLGPTMRAAPPPPSRTTVTAPSMPPPPPPPPHRSIVTHQRIAPQPPPTPPTRNLSLSNGQSSATSSQDLEARFIDQFHSISTFPSPEPFRGVQKFYNSKNAAKQQAPAPPLQSSPTPSTMVQLNASAGGRQWQHNAASSAC